MPVIDASVLVELFYGKQGARKARHFVHEADHELLAPHLIDAEVGSGLRGLTSAGKMEPDVAERSLLELAELPLKRVPHTLLLDDAWNMRSRVSFYDALYLALARAADTALVTFDGRLARAARTFGVEAELLA